MEWNTFLTAFSSGEGFWSETQLSRIPSKLLLMNSVDGTTNVDRQSSDRMHLRLKERFGESVQVHSEEESNPHWQGTGFVIDPIDGSWNYCFGYPAYCRVVSYLEQGNCQFFSIFSEVEKQSICCNGKQLLCNGKIIDWTSEANPMVAVMYNMHYSTDKKRASLEIIERLMTDNRNIRVSGSPGHDLYSLLIGAVGGVINVSPHQYDALPILDCLRRSPLFEIQDLTLDRGLMGQFISRRELAHTISNLL